MAKSKQLRTPWEDFIANNKYKELQRACLIRGMPFNDLVEGTHISLAHFLRKEWNNPLNEERLAEFDEWRHKIMRELGKGDEPYIRLAYMPEQPEEGMKIKIAKEKPISDKPKRKFDESAGVMGGTKKHLTYTSQQAGKTLEETIELVKNQFPDAQEKSISIWFKRAKKANP